jgi:hypothetical protein
MRRYGLYDTTRGLMTALAVGVAGLLLWAATQVGQQTTERFWAEMGIVAAAGLVLALLPAMGGWTNGLRLRVSPGTFLLGFIPTLVVAGWVLVATQPGNGWHDGTLTSWSNNVGIEGVVHDLGLWHGVLAFGLGLVLGLALDTVPALEADEEVVVDRRRGYDRDVDDRRATAGPTWRQRPTDARAADEPLTAEREREREAAAEAEPRTVPAGRPIERDRTEH